MRHEVVNTGTAPVAPQLYLQLVRDGSKLPGESSFYSTFTGPAVYTEAKKFHKIEFSDIDKGKADIDKQATNGYVAMVQHYFASAWILPDGVKRDLFVRKVDGNNLYAVGMIAPLEPIAPGAIRAVEAKFFAGPQEEKLLEQIAPGLDLVKDYGWLTILAKPLYWLLDQLNGILHNWGWSIMALVLIIKIAFYWLQAKGYESMAKMKAINPKVMAMRERCKDNPQQMQQEMMRIYREEKVNPMGGCFPIMVQIPVFIALYWVLLSSVEMRGAPWIGWIQRPVRAGPVLHPAGRDDAHDDAADGAEPDAAGPDAGQADVVHAAGFQRHVLLLPRRPGAVLDHQQHAVDRPAVADQHAHGRAAAVQFAEVQVSRGIAARARNPRGPRRADPRFMCRQRMHARHARPPRRPIAAIATAPGRGAVGIVRVSGAVAGRADRGRLRPRAASRAKHLPGLPRRRRQPDRPGPGDPLPGAAFLHRRGRAGTAGARRAGGAAAAAGALPGSRRRADPATAAAAGGLRVAQPGEFTQRAFLNDKIDLAQAEAIADLIDASTEAAARSASRSLSGEFSREIHALRDALIHLRMLVEATLDFPEEEIDFLQKADAAGPARSRCGRRWRG